jgi:hypothetical protein
MTVVRSLCSPWLEAAVDRETAAVVAAVVDAVCSRREAFVAVLARGCSSADGRCCAAVMRQ